MKPRLRSSIAWWGKTVLLAMLLFVVQSLPGGWGTVEPNKAVLREAKGFPWIWYRANYEHNRPMREFCPSRALLDVGYFVTLTAVTRALIRVARRQREVAGYSSYSRSLSAQLKHLVQWLYRVAASIYHTAISRIRTDKSRRVSVTICFILTAVIGAPFILSFMVPLHYTRGIIRDKVNLPCQEFLLRDGRFLYLRRTPIQIIWPSKTWGIMPVSSLESRFFKWRKFNTTWLLPLDPEARSYVRPNGSINWGEGPNLALSPMHYQKLVLSAWIPGLPILLLCSYPIFALCIGILRVFYERRHGGCQNCGYNLTGNTSGVCPECGAYIAKM
jgi:hypothetical protein